MALSWNEYYELLKEIKKNNGTIIFFLFVIACSFPTFIFQPLYNLPVLTVAVRLPLLQSMHLIMLCP